MGAIFFKGNLVQHILYKGLSDTCHPVRSYPSLILSNDIVSQLNRVWARLSESEKEIMKYLAQQEKAVNLIEVLEGMSGNYSTEIVLNAVRSLKRRCFLEDNQNGEKNSLLRLDRTLEVYARSRKN